MELIIKQNLYFSIILTIILLTFSSCTSQSSKPTEEKTLSKSDISAQIKNNKSGFPIPAIPVMITNYDDIILYLSKHYWDLYNFADTTLITQPDITQQGFVDYIQLLNQLSYSDIKKSINAMLDKAKPHPTMYDYFASLYEKYLYDPNSPFRNDEIYIPVVKHVMKSRILPHDRQEVYTFQQEMILKNRVGKVANNFEYTLANGEKKMMHTLHSNYLILFFTNPDCPSCTTTEQLINSQILRSIFSPNNTNNSIMLTVLSIYPDSNADEWRQSLPKLPQKHWIYSYDDGEVISKKRLYDIKAIPTLYLLDQNKKVILKDTTLEEIERFFIDKNGDLV